MHGRFKTSALRYPSLVNRDEIIRVLRAFENSGLEYVLIGATAMGFHGLVRATEDLDLFIRATPDNIERLRVALRDAYDDDPHIEQISTSDLLGEYPAVRYHPPTGDLYFDILTRLGEAARFETVDAETREVEGTRVSVATPAALYLLKRGTARPKDHQDAAACSSDSISRMKTEVPVQRFRSIEEMNAAPVRPNSSGDFERFLRHCARYWAIAPRIYPRGVFRFRSIEEAQRAREQHHR
ncbi:MAG TPA: nucleotidyl transferase AbiEii/AbiGii toxin family protein [Thermoanaerobaculia bacterium]|nr:nucleotidyl transferase AbiEii/AbiGii toxin family protein [Thermoanaerobaculia bacterium]